MWLCKLELCIIADNGQLENTESGNERKRKAGTETAPHNFLLTALTTRFQAMGFPCDHQGAPRLVIRTVTHAG